jgi:hypothetical protein
MKIHYCCGDIYLLGYENVDIQGKRAHRATVEALAANTTTLDRYYKHPFKDGQPPPPRPYLIDQRLKILATHGWPWLEGTVDEVLMIACFEHFLPHTQIPFIVQQVKRVLRPGGIWRFDFPDIKQTVLQYYDDDPELCMRLLYCNQKDEYSVHHWGYNEKTIPDVLGDGWASLEFGQIVQHDYPMIGCTAVRA